MKFTPRLTKPEKGNKYYNTISAGGYCVNELQKYGEPNQPGLNVLSNCVGYAYGRFHEIAGDKTMSLLNAPNAELFIDYKNPKLKVGTTPELGACIVWQAGATKSGKDGAGHVAIVEQINSDGSIVTSESGWGCKNPFWTTKRVKGADGNWGMNSNYKFLGFIYQPEKQELKTSFVTKIVNKISGDKVTTAFNPYLVRVEIKDLNIRSGPGTNYARTGKFTGIGTFTIVEESDGQGATKWGKLKSGAGWISLDYVVKL